MKILSDYLKDESRIVKTFAMQALSDIAERDEELRPGIIKQLEALTRIGSPAMKSRGKKLLARLKSMYSFSKEGQVSNAPTLESKI